MHSEADHDVNDTVLSGPSKYSSLRAACQLTTVNVDHFAVGLTMGPELPVRQSSPSRDEHGATSETVCAGDEATVGLPLQSQNECVAAKDSGVLMAENNNALEASCILKIEWVRLRHSSVTFLIVVLFQRLGNIVQSVGDGGFGRRWSVEVHQYRCVPSRGW